jgi:spoIIIJ-associated protein
MEKEFFGNDLDEALARAMEQLGMAREDLRYRELPQRFGNLLKSAKVAIIVDVEQPVAPRPSQQDASRWLEMEPVEKIRYFLEGLFQKLGLQASVKLIEKPDTLIAAIDLKDSELDIKKGDGREFRGALQHLVNRVVSNTTSAQRKIVIDIGGVLENREKVLAEWSGELAKLVESRKKKLFIYLMDSQDRRLLHNALKDQAGIQTESQGETTYRVFCVEPVHE